MTYIPVEMIPPPRNIKDWRNDLKLDSVYVFNDMRKGEYLILKEIEEDGCIFENFNNEIFFKDWGNKDNLYKVGI